MLRQPTRRGDYPGRDRCGPSDPGLLGLPGLGMAQNSGIIPQMWAFLNIAGQTLDGYLVCFRALLTSKNLAFFFLLQAKIGHDWGSVLCPGYLLLLAIWLALQNAKRYDLKQLLNRALT